MSNDLPKIFWDAASSVSSSIMSEVYALREFFFKKRHVIIFSASGKLRTEKGFAAKFQHSFQFLKLFQASI